MEIVLLNQLKGRIKNKLRTDTHFLELVKGSSIAFILRIIGIFFGYMFTFLVTRFFGAKAWGIFALSTVLLQISSVVGRLGMDTALLRFTAEYVAKGEIKTLREIYKKALTLVIPFSILVTILVYFLSPILANRVFNKSYLILYFHIISFVIIPFVLLWIHSESIRGLKKIKEYMLLQQSGIFGISLIILIVIMYVIGKSTKLPLISYAVSITILSLIAWLFWNKSLLSLLSTSINKQILNDSFSYKTLLSVSIPMFFSSSLALIMGWTDTIMLGIFRSTQEVGVYNVALRLSMITSISLMAINTIAAPKFAEFWGKGDIKGLAKIAQQSTKLIFWTSFPILLIFLIFPKPILGIFGEEFKAGVITLIVLTFGQFINSISGSVGYILQMTGGQDIFRNIILITMVMNIIINVNLIPKFGINGAAFASAISMTFWNITCVLYIAKKYNIITSRYIKFLLKGVK